MDLGEIIPVTYNMDLRALQNVNEAKSLGHAIYGLKKPYRGVIELIKTRDIALVCAMVRKGKYETASKARLGDEFGFNVILAFSFTARSRRTTWWAWRGEKCGAWAARSS